jgi:hypothetical protein
MEHTVMEKILKTERNISEEMREKPALLLHLQKKKWWHI